MLKLHECCAPCRVCRYAENECSACFGVEGSRWYLPDGLQGASGVGKRNDNRSTGRFRGGGWTGCNLVWCTAVPGQDDPACHADWMRVLPCEVRGWM